MDEMVEGDLGIKDGRIQVAAPKSIFDPNVRVWRSVANEAGAWADYVSQKTGVARSAALTACMRLARLVDDDLRAAQVDTETKIDISLPNVTREWTDRNGNKQCEVGLGLHKQKLFDGSDQYAVLFKNERPKLLDSKGKEFVRPLADRGEGWNDVAALRLPAPANAGLHSVPGRGFDRKVKNDWGTPVIEYTNISQDLLPGFKPAMNV
jgi:hypothetical protein